MYVQMASPTSPVRRRIIRRKEPYVNKLKRKAPADDPTWVDSCPTIRHQKPDDCLIDGFAKVLSPRHLVDLPQEILLNIIEHFAEPWALTNDLADWEVYKLDRESRARQKTLIALTKTCRRLNESATSTLYRCAHIPTAKSLLSFVSSLYIQKSLAKLVKQVSCPQDVLMTVAHAFYSYPRFKGGGVPSTVLVQHISDRIGRSRPSNEPSQFYNSYCNDHVHCGVLSHISKLIPGIRALSISCVCPWHIAYPISPLPLEHLAKLSIATLFQPEDYMGSPNLTTGSLTWLNKSTLGQYPALQQLELVHPRGKWIAHLVTDKTTTESGSERIEKSVESLTTLRRYGGGFAIWELLSLEQDIFSPAHLRTLDYAGPSRRFNGERYTIQQSGWDLNRFFRTRGRGITTLSLDWEHDHKQLGHLGQTGRLTSLPLLTNLTHLTVSMQLLFDNRANFYRQLLAILADQEAELPQRLPPSLRVLRISDFMLGVLVPDDPGSEDRSIESYNRQVFNFVQVLRACWLDARGDRELWFRHCLRLERHPRMANEEARCKLRYLMGAQRHQDVGKEFAPVIRMPPRVAASTRERIQAM